MAQRVRGWIVAGIVLAVVVAVFAYEWVGTKEEARAAGEQADSLRILNRELRIRQQSDSTTLARERSAYVLRMDSIEARRRVAQQEAARASLTARAARESVRRTLDSIGAPTAGLDSLEAAHDAEIVAVRQDRDLADSAVVAVRSLLVVTESALLSERDLRLGVEEENLALRAQVRALERARTLDRLVGVGTIAAVITTAILLR